MKLTNKSYDNMAVYNGHLENGSKLNMKRTIFALTIIFFTLALASDRLKNWLMERNTVQFILIIAASIAGFLALLARVFGII